MTEPKFTTEPKPTKTETLFGGIDLTAVKFDGLEEPIRIKQLPAKQMNVYLAAQDDEGKMIELFCGKEPGWSENLAPDSWEKIVTEGERLNADFFGRWFQRRLDRQEKLMPGLKDRLLAAVSTSPTPSPVSLLPAA